MAYPTLELSLKSQEARKVKKTAEDVRAFLTGDFTLASGKKSEHYFDGKRLTLSAEGSYRVGRVIYDEIAGLAIDAIGGLATGAYPIATAVAMVSHLEGNPINAFVVREVPKEHGTRKKIEGHVVKGSRVVIVDDVITTGESIVKAIEAVKEVGCEVVKIVVVVDRHEGGSKLLEDKGYDFISVLDLSPSSGKVTLGEATRATGQAKTRLLRK